MRPCHTSLLPNSASHLALLLPAPLPPPLPTPQPQARPCRPLPPSVPLPHTLVQRQAAAARRQRARPPGARAVGGVVVKVVATRALADGPPRAVDDGGGVRPAPCDRDGAAGGLDDKKGGQAQSLRWKKAGGRGEEPKPAGRKSTKEKKHKRPRGKRGRQRLFMLRKAARSGEYPRTHVPPTPAAAAGCCGVQEGGGGRVRRDGSAPW